MLRELSKIFMRLSGRDSNGYVKRLRKRGAQIGLNCRIFSPKNTLIDSQNPHLLTFGDNVRITQGVIILTHDYSWSVATGLTGEMYGGVGPVRIGNNVFIGMNSIILRGTTISDNVIIGAGSVVRGHVEKDSVYTGNPASRIMSIQDYIARIECRQALEAQTAAKQFAQRWGNTRPVETALSEYFALYKMSDELNNLDRNQIRRTGFEKEVLHVMSSRKPQYAGLQDLLQGEHQNSTSIDSSP